MADTEFAVIQYKDYPPQMMEAYEIGDMVADYMNWHCPDWDGKDVIEVMVDERPYWIARRIVKVVVQYEYDSIPQDHPYARDKFFSWEFDVPRKAQN